MMLEETGRAEVVETKPSGGRASTRRFTAKQDQLISAATEILNERGLKGFTLAEVAKKTGLITQGVAYYFPKKDDLATACILRTLERIDALIPVALAEETAEARISAFLRGYVDLAGDVYILGAPQLATLAEVRALAEPNVGTALEAIVQLFQRLRQLFDVPELAWMDRHARIARTVLLLQLALAIPTWIFSKERSDYQRTFERMLDILLNGLVTKECWGPAALALTPPPGESAQREAFLIAATQLINEEGYRGASVEKISARLNVSKGAFYHHNDAKDDMVVRCFERTIAIFTQNQLNAAALDGDQWHRLTSACAALAQFQLSAHGPLLRSAALYALPPGATPHIVREWELVTHRFAGLVSDGIAEGSIRPVDPRIASELIMVALNSAAELPSWLQTIEQDEIADLYVRPLLCGLLKP